MLSNPHLHVARYIARSVEVFPGVDIRGGLCLSRWDNRRQIGPVAFFTPYSELAGILRKVRCAEEASMSTLVAPRGLYRLTDRLYLEHPYLEGRQSAGHKYSLGANIFQLLPEIFHPARQGRSMLPIYGLMARQRVERWVETAYVNRPCNLESYKVILPKSNGTGRLGDILSSPIVGTPMLGYTDTFLGIGNFDSSQEAEACLKYIKTKFARAMLGILKVTQDNARAVWRCVPIQDFTAGSDLNWLCPVSEIDTQLYEKYRLDRLERLFIEQAIPAMK